MHQRPSILEVRYSVEDASDPASGNAELFRSGGGACSTRQCINITTCDVLVIRQCLMAPIKARHALRQLFSGNITAVGLRHSTLLGHLMHSLPPVWKASPPPGRCRRSTLEAAAWRPNAKEQHVRDRIGGDRSPSLGITHRVLAEMTIPLGWTQNRPDITVARNVR